MTKDNNSLGKFHLDGIAPAPRGVPQIEVTFDIDANGILSVSALDKATNKSNQITIKNDKGRLSKDDIDKMINEAEKFKEDDKLVKETVEARNNLESYCYQVKGSLSEDNIKKVVGDEVDSLIKQVDDTLEWFENNQDAKKEEYETKMKDLENVINQ